MGREDAVTELCCSIGPQRAMRTINIGRFPTAQKKPGTWVKTRKFTNFSKCQNVGSSKNLVTSSSDAAEHLVGRPPDGERFCEFFFNC